MPTGNPIAVTLVGTAAAESLIRASHQNPALCVLPDGATLVSPVEHFRTLGVSGAYFLDGEPTVTIVVVNALAQPLSFGTPWVKHGEQTGYPDESNRVAGWKPNVQIMWNFTEGKAQAGSSLVEDQIPAARIDPFNPANPLFGAGVYRFHTTHTVWGIDGAMQFAYGGSAFGGIAWMNPYTEASSPALGVTADLANYGSSLEKFYDATAGASKNELSSKSKEIDIRCNLWYRPKGEGPITDLNAPYWSHSPVMIVSVRPA